MNHEKRIILRASGLLAGSAALASLSSLVTTKYLMHLAVDREEPKLIKLAERAFAGNAEEDSFLHARIEAGNRLKAKPCETVRITSHDGEVLVGHWMPVKDAKRIIIAVHGWRATWYQTFGLVADSWAENGCSALFIEQRASENSGGDTISFGLIERYDCRDWVLWVNEHLGRELPIYLCGVSMGASTVLMASSLDLPSVHGIIADCGYTSPRAIWKHVANNNLHISFGLRGAIADELLKQKIQMSSDEYSTTEALRNSRIPVIFIHGANDHFVPVTMTYENYLACAGPKRLLIVPGADHGQSYFVERERYEDEVKRFWADFD